MVAHLSHGKKRRPRHGRRDVHDEASSGDGLLDYVRARKAPSGKRATEKPSTLSWRGCGKTARSKNAFSSGSTRICPKRRSPPTILSPPGGFIHLDQRWSFWNSPRDVLRIDLERAGNENELVRPSRQRRAQVRPQGFKRKSDHTAGGVG